MRPIERAFRWAVDTVLDAGLCACVTAEHLLMKARQKWTG